MSTPSIVHRSRAAAWTSFAAALLALAPTVHSAGSALPKRSVYSGPSSRAPELLRDCPPPTSFRDAPTIRIAICLDTSGSMEGLLNQARTRLWDLVNFCATARFHGAEPVLQVALFQYGSDQLPASEGYMRCVQPFTTDLDLVSQRLFELTISGSSEYCGMVLDKAAKELDWSGAWRPVPVGSIGPSRRLPSYATLVIAGNEEFTQGSVDYQKPVIALQSLGVYVNTIYCGAYGEGEKSGWLNAAYLNGGSYSNIDQDERREYIRCPQDERLLTLNSELNRTYLAYSSAGAAGAARQAAQDESNLAASPEAGVQRIATKAGAQYRNASWDLLDALDDNSVRLETIRTEDLPEDMRPMTLDQRRAYVEQLRAERRRIKDEIQRLTKEREAFLRDKHKHRPRGKTLDSALIQAIRTQAQTVGFTFPPPSPD